MNIRLGRFPAVTVAVLACALWAAFAWPLPRYWRTGIPSSAHNIERGQAREMIPGDHLQLLYHFWLAADMLAGHTPLFENRYEFNTGNDAARREVGSYYVPFSLLFALGHALGGLAVGWNLTGLVSLVLSAVCTYGLVRRHTPRVLPAVCGALLAVALPYRWGVLLGGSPTGFAMLWVPLLALAVDDAVRGARRRGSILAVLTLACACATDLHVFYYLALALPLWILLAVSAAPARVAWSRLAAAVAPSLLAAGVLALVYLRAGARAPASRSPDEVLQYAPAFGSLWRGWVSGSGVNTYVGLLAIALLGAGGLALTVRAWRTRATADRRAWLRFALLSAACLCVAVLAAGPRGPNGGLIHDLCRHGLPGYASIRQTAKIFLLMPTLLGLTAALALESLAALVPRRAAAAVGTLVLTAIILAQYRAQISVTICVLAPRQAAFAAVAADAAHHGVDPHALAVGFWHGDVHYGSIYQYYASRYRIRMVNGYSPSIPAGYVTNTYLPFAGINTGFLPPAQCAALRAAGIRYVLVYEGLLPEKLSPYPVACTLARLRQNPELSLLAQDGPVWAFRIEDRPHAAETVPDPAPIGSAGQWRLAPGAPLAAGPIATAPAPEQRWRLRARGTGTLDCVTLIAGQTTPAVARHVDAAEWTWVDVPLPPLEAFVPVALEGRVAAGTVAVDHVLLAAGPWQPPSPGATLTLPAATFFHGGESDADRQSVKLRAARDAEGIQLYGPKLPLDTGVYTVALVCNSPAPEGTPLGRFNMRWSGDEEAGWVEVRAGQSAATRFVQAQNLPVQLVFLYTRLADMEIERVTLERVE